ncbi:MAG TPA: hypothetical protein EYN69_09170 [Flavobacteriales bacterium]|nr:hypothetical protein [Flavobacteriales bacterium]
MEEIHKILKYQFASIDIEGFIGGFEADRREACLSQFEFDLDVASSVEPEYEAEQYCLSLVSAELSIEGGFRTKEFFAHCFNNLVNGDALQIDSNTTVDKLQKKFEIFHRIYSRYNEDVRKISDGYQDAEMYALMAIVLLLRYRHSNNFNDLNTAIKINDILLFADWDLSSNGKSLIRSSVRLEHTILKELDF